MAHQIRSCAICLQSDDHPRIERVSNIPGTVDVNYHHDCYALAVGDQDPEMQAIVKHAAGKQGQELRDYLLSPEHRKFKAKLEADIEAQHPGVKS